VSTVPVFLLSPAFCGGRRAGYLLRKGSELALARRLRDRTLTLGEAFAFMSGLYFRGKLAYASRFGTVLVITPTRGLQPPETIATPALLREFAAVDVDENDLRYRKPLHRDVRRLAATLQPERRIVLLGSIATGKYVDVLTSVIGPRLEFPIDFIGRGDMSRGGLLLRAVAAGLELPYASLTPELSRRGSRPPKLTPIPR
jgi:hypothetical protein